MIITFDVKLFYTSLLIFINCAFDRCYRNDTNNII